MGRSYCYNRTESIYKYANLSIVASPVLYRPQSRRSDVPIYRRRRVFNDCVTSRCVETRFILRFQRGNAAAEFRHDTRL